MDEAVERHGISRIADTRDLTSEDFEDPRVSAVLDELRDTVRRLSLDQDGVRMVNATGIAWAKDGVPLGCIDVDTVRGKFMYTIERSEDS